MIHKSTVNIWCNINVTSSLLSSVNKLNLTCCRSEYQGDEAGGAEEAGGEADLYTSGEPGPARVMLT